MSSDARTIVINFYLDYVNNYLTSAKWSEHNGLSEQQGSDLLLLASKIFNSDHPES